MASWSAERGIRLRELDKKQAVNAVLPHLDYKLNEADLADLTRAFKAFPGAVKAAILKATNRTRQYARNALVRNFRALLTLKPAYIGKGIKSSVARPVGNGAEAEIRIATHNIPLGRYGITPETPPRLKGVPVASRVRTSYALRLDGKTYDDTPHDAPRDAGRLFVAGMGSGHIGAFYRVGGSKGGIVQEWAPSLQYHAHADGFMENISTLTAARFRTTFKDEARRITGVTA